MQLPLVVRLRELLADGDVYTSAFAHPDAKYKLLPMEMRTDMAELQQQDALVKVPCCISVPGPLLELPRRVLSELNSAGEGSRAKWPAPLRCC